jgi:uncharacterized protein YbjT (DUF2867 family)
MAMTLVLGGSGKTARRVVKRLTAKDLPVRIGSRHGGLPFDWTDRASWGHRPLRARPRSRTRAL